MVTLMQTCYKPECLIRPQGTLANLLEAGLLKHMAQTHARYFQAILPSSVLFEYVLAKTV